MLTPAEAEPSASPSPPPLAAVPSPVSASWPQPGYGNKAFTGREWDPEIGLYYYRARYYDPEVGRFISEDPIGFEGGNVNLYEYVESNPGRFVDSFGLLTEVFTFAPVGHGKSSFGHTAINVNGTTYSFGENGWFVEKTADYLERNSFRDAVGQELDLTPEQEQRLVDAIWADIARHPKWTSEMNCSSKARDMLEQGTGYPFALPPRPKILLPPDFRDNLLRFGYVTKTNYYAKAN